MLELFVTIILVSDKNVDILLNIDKREMTMI